MNATGSVVLMPVARTSPTLWSQMRLCRLRAAFSTQKDAENWVLHDPRVWLGMAFHRVMEAGAADLSEAASVWDAKIADLQAALSSHPLDLRFANPERWPGFYLVRQRAIASAVVNGSRGRSPRPQDTSHGSTFRSRERFLTARSGRLVGRPDRFDRSTVSEYKSSLPDRGWAEAETIMDGYWRQLQLYAVLIGELGTWPSTMQIVAASGQMIKRPVNRAACESEADAAVLDLDVMNQMINSGCNVNALANPSQLTCGQCSYISICPSFWEWFDAPSWPGLRKPAVRGTLLAVDPGMDGDLYTITMNLVGNRSICEVQSLVLRKSIHGDLTGLPEEAEFGLCLPTVAQMAVCKQIFLPVCLVRSNCRRFDVRQELDEGLLECELATDAKNSKANINIEAVKTRTARARVISKDELRGQIEKLTVANVIPKAKSWERAEELKAAEAQICGP